MASPLQAIMAMLQGQRPQPSVVRPDYGLTGAMISAQRSPYEPTLAPGETRSRDELRSMLGGVIEAAGMAVVPGVGPRQIEMRPPGGRSYTEMRGLKGSGGAEIVRYEWRSKPSSESQRKLESDWENSSTSQGTGREIVHVFQVRHPDGSITNEGINSASNILGMPQSTLKGKAASAMKYELERQRNIDRIERSAAKNSDGQLMVRGAEEIRLAPGQQGPGIIAELEQRGWTAK